MKRGFLGRLVDTLVRSVATPPPGPLGQVRGAPHPGTALGAGYVVRQTIGCGGHGVVLEVVHEPTGKPYAAKLLHAHLAASEELVARLELEAAVAGRIDHPNVARTLGLERTGDGAPFIVMELLEGQTLTDRMDRGLLSLREVAEVLRDSARGLQAAHEAGVVHRDVKPANLFLVSAKDGVRAKLTDFGISKLLTGAPGLTVEGTAIGTPEYMSPEQAAGEQVGPASDVYSLGIVLWAMLFGRPPFVGSPMTVMQRQVEAPLPAFPSSRPDLPDRLAKAVVGALAKEPGSRRRLTVLQADACAVLDALDGKPVAVAEPEPEPVRPPGATLVVDDDAAVLRVLSAVLRQAGLEVGVATSGAEALEQLAARPFDVVVSDVRMPGMDGMTLLRRVQAEHPGTRVILLTAHGSVALAVEALKAGASDFLLKPFDSAEVVAKVREALSAAPPHPAHHPPP